MSRARAALPALPALFALALAGCATAPAASWRALPADDPRPARLTAGLRALAAERHALRASARVEAAGPEGSGFSRQLLLVERPARLRVEVLGGLLEQRVLVLATDGERYELYRAEQAGFESGEVHPGVLDEVAGLPLTPEAAASLLLATPRAPEDAPVARVDETGALSLAWPDQTLDFDAQGRLVALAFHPGARDVLRARWSEWRESAAGGAFPHRLELERFEPEAHWRLDFRHVELNPALAPELFRLRGDGR